MPSPASVVERSPETLASRDAVVAGLPDDGHAPRVEGGSGHSAGNRQLVIVPEHTRELGGFMNLQSLQRKAKQLIDRRGGTDSLKADAEELKDIAKSSGSVADKAKRAGDALKDPGAKGPDTPASPRPPATDTPAPTAEPATPPAPEADAPGTPKPRTPPGA